MTGETRCHGTTAQVDAPLSAGMGRMVHSKEHKPCHQLQEEDVKQQRGKRNGSVKTHNHNDVHDERKKSLATNHQAARGAAIDHWESIARRKRTARSTT